MKVQLETIPVWDGVRSGDECFLCSLMREAEEDGVRYYLSSAIMTPEVRVTTNDHGFCTKHFSLLAEANKAQSLGLVMDTYYQKNAETFDELLDKVSSSSSPRKAQKLFSSFFDSYHEREEGCLICSRMKDRLDRYTFTVASLYGEDPEFRQALENSKGFCIHHTEALFKMAPEALSGDVLVSFYKTLASLLKTNLERVRQDDWWLTQKYKSENRDKPWNGCEDAAKRAVYKFTGQARVVDPVKR